MRNEIKKVVSSIKMNDNINDNLKLYNELICTSYSQYAMVKSSLNYFTMKETISEYNKKADVCTYFNTISKIINDVIINNKNVTKGMIEKVKDVRMAIERKMHILTSFTDGYEIYEYILNRVEAKVTDTIEDVNIEQLSSSMFQYVFSENDTVVINSKLQLIMSQLPVRMTKNKFFDIISNTLQIYNAGETTSLDEFVEMLESTALLKLPEGFETEYPLLYEVYQELSSADYKNIDLDTYNNLKDKLVEAAKIIELESTAYILLQEIVNDIYCILLTIKVARDNNLENKYYLAANKIFEFSMNSKNMEELPDELMDAFIVLEGVQEKMYENIMILDSAFEEVVNTHNKEIKELKLTSDFANLTIAQKLLSTSLFVNINADNSNESETVDNEYIRNKKEDLITKFTDLFTKHDRIVNRSIMCKVISCMPIFMNTQQEIKNYFDYVLENCKDDSELTACSKLICDIIEEV